MSINLRNNVIIFLVASLLFIPFLGAVHLFDWDEINFAESAREMIASRNYFLVQINYLPFWEKPPLFIWMQVLSMKIFGINEFAARFPNGVCGIVTLLVLFNIGRRLINEKFGWIWILTYAGSLLPHFYFKSGIIDPWFNLFIFLGIFYFILFSRPRITNTEKPKLRVLALSAVFIGLAILTKGPVALLIFILCFLVYWISIRFEQLLSVKEILFFGFLVLLVGGSWFLLLILNGDGGLIKEFIWYQVRLFTTGDAGHGGPFFYHWIVLLFGCFPMSVIGLQSFKRNTSDAPGEAYFKKWMLIMFWVVLILFSVVKTKIIHYSSLCYFPLSFLATYVIVRLIDGRLAWNKFVGIMLMFLAIVLGILISSLPVIDHYKNKIIAAGMIKDKFAVECLKANVPWSGLEWLIGMALIVGIAWMLVLIHQRVVQTALIGIFLVSLVTANIAMTVIVPRVEQYSQAAAIRFYQSLKGKGCYVATLGFKSYAQFFYQAKKQPENKDSYNTDWLLSGPVDKPAFFVCKIDKVAGIAGQYPQLKELYRENGFVFLVRYQTQ
jgi:4-amino-4-deoxy-L-arabinose transferase-like glycosyltransferase